MDGYPYQKLYVANMVEW